VNDLLQVLLAPNRLYAWHEIVDDKALPTRRRDVRVVLRRLRTSGLDSYRRVPPPRVNRAGPSVRRDCAREADAGKRPSERTRLPELADPSTAPSLGGIMLGGQEVSG
jgi:hypothetical protein